MELMQYDKSLVIDILSHHYFDLDANVIFEICTEHISDLLRTLKKVKSDLS